METSLIVLKFNVYRTAYQSHSWVFTQDKWKSLAAYVDFVTKTKTQTKNTWKQFTWNGQTVVHCPAQPSTEDQTRCTQLHALISKALCYGKIPDPKGYVLYDWFHLYIILKKAKYKGKVLLELWAGGHCYRVGVTQGNLQWWWWNCSVSQLWLHNSEFVSTHKIVLQKEWILLYVILKLKNFKVINTQNSSLPNCFTVDHYLLLRWLTSCGLCLCSGNTDSARPSFSSSSTLGTSH